MYLFQISFFCVFGFKEFQKLTTLKCMEQSSCWINLQAITVFEYLNTGKPFSKSIFTVWLIEEILDDSHFPQLSWNIPSDLESGNRWASTAFHRRPILVPAFKIKCARLEDSKNLQLQSQWL